MNQPRRELSAEEKAAALHNYSLDLDFGGIKKPKVYFSIETGDEPDEWVVSDGAQLFYEGTDISHLFDWYEVDQKIYEQSAKVEEQIQDHLYNDMADFYYPNYDDDIPLSRGSAGPY